MNMGSDFVAAYVIDQMGSTRYAFYVGSAGDCLAAIIFIIVLFINRDSVSKCRTCHSRDDDSIQDDSSCEEVDNVSMSQRKIFAFCSSLLGVHASPNCTS